MYIYIKLLPMIVIKLDYSNHSICPNTGKEISNIILFLLILHKFNDKCHYMLVINNEKVSRQ